MQQLQSPPLSMCVFYFDPLTVRVATETTTTNAIVVVAIS
jgi:hypothetical protein